MEFNLSRAFTSMVNVCHNLLDWRVISERWGCKIPSWPYIHQLSLDSYFGSYSVAIACRDRMKPLLSWMYSLF